MYINDSFCKESHESPGEYFDIRNTEARYVSQGETEEKMASIRLVKFNMSWFFTYSIILVCYWPPLSIIIVSVITIKISLLIHYLVYAWIE